jgi:hypothetical protein
LRKQHYAIWTNPCDHSCLWPWHGGLLTPSRAIVCVYINTLHVNCKLMSLEMPIFEKQKVCYMSHYFVCGDLCWNFAHFIVLQKIFNMPKIKNAVMPKKLSENPDIFAFFKRMALQNVFIFCLQLVYIVSKIFHKKNFRMNFVCMCCHSNKLCVTKTDINWKKKHESRWTTWYICCMFN